jgi:hypothetical protein
VQYPFFWGFYGSRLFEFETRKLGFFHLLLSLRPLEKFKFPITKNSSFIEKKIPTASKYFFKKKDPSKGWWVLGDGLFKNCHDL